MARKNKDLYDRVKEAVMISAILGICGAAVKTWKDVQELKVRFDYVYGKWSVPPDAKK